LVGKPPRTWRPAFRKVGSASYWQYLESGAREVAATHSGPIKLGSEAGNAGEVILIGRVNKRTFVVNTGVSEVDFNKSGLLFLVQDQAQEVPKYPGMVNTTQAMTLLGIMEIVGPVVLLIAVIYGVSRNRKRTRAEKLRTDAATRDLYKKEDEAKTE
jgi:hypothetical protein